MKKKQEAKELLEKEMSSIQPVAKIPQSKITRAQVEAENEKRNKAIENMNKEPKPVSIGKLQIVSLFLFFT